MSINKTGLRKRATLATPRRYQIVIAVTVVLSVMIAWTMLVYSRPSYSVFRQKDISHGTVAIQGLNSGSPSAEYIYAAGRLLAKEEPAPCGDTQPPVFTNPYPPPINIAASYQCPYATSAQANYTNPPATDNSGNVTVSCNPASGSSFALGATTITCTASDPCNNTATCSFVVNVFSACLVDETNPGNVVLFNATTGDYRFCCNGVAAASGRGTLTVNGCNITIHDVKGNRTVDISVTGTSSGSGNGGGSATIKKSGVTTCQITDSTLTGDMCICP